MTGNKGSEAVSCVWANTTDALREVFRLRYQCYRRSGAIPESTDGLFFDPFDSLPNHFSFLLSGDSQGAIATMRVSVVSPDRGWLASPAEKVFSDEPAFQSLAQTSFVEASRLCFQRAARRDVLYRLLANMAAMADHFGAKWLVACPRIEHSHMYKRQFGFRAMSAARQYYGVSFLTDLLATPVKSIGRTAESVPSMRSAWAEASAFIATCMPSAVTSTAVSTDPCRACGAPHLCGAGCPM